MPQIGQHEPAGITITFPLFRQVSPLKSYQLLSEVLSQNKIAWLRPAHRGLWSFRSDLFKAVFPEYSSELWLKGDILVPMDHDIRREKAFGKEEERTYCQIIVTPKIVEDQMPKKVFLSHKGGADKPMVRRCKTALQSVGIEAWLDEDSMPAGTELERGLLAGMQASCAAVFLITPRYADTGYLAAEINYAVSEKRKRGTRFAIITLIVRDPDGQVGSVPPLLEPYVWKTPATELDGFIEVIKALPIEVGPPTWKL